MTIKAVSNYSFLGEHDQQFVLLGTLAEDPNACLIKLRQFAELLAELVASRVGLFIGGGETRVDLIRWLEDITETVV